MKISSNFDGVKYTIYYSKRSEEWIIICVQDFDIPDYDEDYFYDNKLYDTEEKACAALESFGLAELNIFKDALYGRVIGSEQRFWDYIEALEKALLMKGKNNE